MKPILLLLASCACALWLSSCSTSSVIATGPDTYMVSSSGAGFAEGPTLQNVYAKANEFCAQKGLVMVPLDIDSRAGVYASHPPSARLTFRALKPGDPRIKEAKAGAPDTIIRIQNR